MKIIVKIIPKGKETVGGYFQKNGTLRIVIPDRGYDQANYLCAAGRILNAMMLQFPFTETEKKDLSAMIENILGMLQKYKPASE